MDDDRMADVTDQAGGEEIVAEQSPLVEATSTVYLGRWNRLVSTTNWEKGRIISEWRTALIEAGAAATASTDEAWSRRVGNVSPQHAGRLRRVFQRFGSIQEAYASLFWSHFQAALDWGDAEMWLEGAVQNGWSISEMQAQRAQTLGAIDEPLPAEPPAAELDEDAAGDLGQPPSTDAAVWDAGPVSSEPRGPSSDESAEPADRRGPEPAEASTDAPPLVRPFENLPSLPPDLSEAFEAFKLAIIRQRISNWQEVSCANVVLALDALRQLAEAPSDG
jgi:hypothetical protein